MPSACSAASSSSHPPNLKADDNVSAVGVSRSPAMMQVHTTNITATSIPSNDRLNGADLVNQFTASQRFFRLLVPPPVPFSQMDDSWMRHGAFHRVGAICSGSLEFQYQQEAQSVRPAVRLAVHLPDRSLDTEMGATAFRKLLPSSYTERIV